MQKKSFRVPCFAVSQQHRLLLPPTAGVLGAVLLILLGFTGASRCVGQAASTPYGGTAAAIPGTFQAEDFDSGGEGVAYHDDTATNIWGAYRPNDAVDILGCTDTGGGYLIGAVYAGEWLKYSVNVTAAGTYVLSSRVACSGTGGTFHVECDGVNKTGPIQVSNTGGWSTWYTVSSPSFSLTAGPHVLRFVMDSNGPNNTIANFNWFSIHTPVGNSAYGGTPVAVPAFIQAENYDLGDADQAYHDTDTVNTGAVYRSDGVDINTCTDTGGGYQVISAVAGEWLKYSLSVPSASSYVFLARFNAAAGGGTYHAELDGANVTGTLTVPAGTGWQTAMTPPFAVTAGTHVLRVVLDGNGSGGYVANFNWFRLLDPSTSTPYGGTALSIPGTIQAEDFDNGGQDLGYHDNDSTNAWGQYRPSEGVDINTCSDPNGYCVGAAAGEWLKYTVNVATAGTYVIGSRVAAAGGGTFHIEIDGADKTGALSVGNTGGWDTWQTLNKSGATLSAGPHSVRVVFDTQGGSGSTGNFNYFTFTLTAGNNPPTVNLVSPTAGTVVPAGSAVSLSATAADSDGTVAKVEFFAGSTKLGEATSAPYNFSWSNAPAGIYSLTAKATDDLGGTTTSAPVTLIVNAPPTVAITAPTDGSSVAAGAPISVTATAADSDGTVAKVEFFVGSTKIGEAATAPYALNWNNVAPGVYTLTAKATDDRGAVTTSAPVGITVTGPPSVTVVATTPKIWENGAVAGVFTVTRAGSTAGDLTVAYSVGGAAQSGVRYVALSGTVTIPSGSASATISVNPINDTIIQGDQMVTVTLTSSPDYRVSAPYTAGVLIIDDETCVD